MKLILASGSPRRKELLASLGYLFTVEAAAIDESLTPGISLEEAVEDLSFRKAKAVFQKNSNSLVIGSDTIVVLEGNVLGKPKSVENAAKMLRLLQGKVHQVITGVSILSDEGCETFSVTSDVYFQKMSEEEITFYANSKEPLDKAGAYGIQGIGGRYIEKINGDYYAIMGFPINEIYNRLKKYSIDK